jgi:hypothetical protein
MWLALRSNLPHQRQDLRAREWLLHHWSRRILDGHRSHFPFSEEKRGAVVGYEKVEKAI